MQLRKYIDPKDDLSYFQMVDLRAQPRNAIIPGSFELTVFEASEFLRLKSLGFASKKGNEITQKGMERLNKMQPDLKGAKLVLVCKDGGLISKFAWEYFREFSEVYIYKGGYRNYRKYVNIHNLYGLCRHIGFLKILELAKFGILSKNL